MAPCVAVTPLARAGLGNELIPLAKAWVAAQALGVPLVPTAWGANRRSYWRHFSSSRLDVVGHEAALAGRTKIPFEEAEYRRTGLLDYGAAVRAWWPGAKVARSALISSGMWGGFVAIERARPFIRGYLTESRFAAANVAALRARRLRRTKLVAVHVRGGDFDAAGGGGGGGWNRALPIEWYRGVCEAIRRSLGDAVQFLVLGADAAGSEQMLAERFSALTTWDQQNTDVSDLLLLSSADLLVCSVSSFSLLAAWLGDSPYLWPRAQLHEEDGWLSIWGQEPAQQTGLTAANRSRLSSLGTPPLARGIPAEVDGRFTTALQEALRARRGPWERRADLIYYGVVRDRQRV